MFLNAFQSQPDPAEAEQPKSESKPTAHGEFTQLFGTQNPVNSPPHSQPATAPPQETPKQPSEEATRIFVRQAAPPAEPPVVRAVPIPASPAAPPRMKGFSSPGASDSASADGSFTQLFRAVPPPSSPPIQPPPAQASSAPPVVEKPEWPSSAPKSLGATELFRALSVDEGVPADRNTRRPDSFSEPGPVSASPGSVTMWIQKLSEDLGPSSPPPAPFSAQAFDPQPLAATPEPAPSSGQGEFTRIISGGAVKAAAGVSAPPVAPAVPAAPAIPVAPAIKVQAPAIEPPKPAAPKLSPPAVPPPQSKLQQMLPILLVLNAFLLVVLILVVVFVLLRK